VLRFGLAIAVATPLFAFVERPFLRLKGRWSVVTPPPRAAAPAVALADGEAPSRARGIVGTFEAGTREVAES
jgi:hypothetical protein